MSCSHDCKCQKSEAEPKPDVYKRLDELEAENRRFRRSVVMSLIFDTVLVIYLVFHVLQEVKGTDKAKSVELFRK